MPNLRRLLYPAYRKLETNVHPLRYLFLEITQVCNLNCRHCGSDCGRNTQLDELDTEDWLRFFAYLGEHFDRRKLAVVITGGEPLCHPEWDRILDGLKEQGLAWGMVTNGYDLTEGAVKKLTAHNLNSVTVSLDGLKKNHDWLRGKKGSFDRAVRGLKHLAAAHIPFFDVVTCVNPRNLDELPEIMRLLKQVGVPRWRLFSIFPKGRAAGDSELLLDKDGFVTMLDFIRRAKEEHKDQDFDLNFSCEGYLPKEWESKVREEPYFCRAGISIGSVLCDGAISACPNISRSLVQGNIRKDDFKTIWDKRFQVFRDRRWLKQGPCADCKLFNRCQGNSLHLYDDELGHTALCTHRLLTDPEIKTAADSVC